MSAPRGLERVRATLAERRAAGLWRDLVARDPARRSPGGQGGQGGQDGQRSDGRTLLDLASNDYLGLAADPRITEAAAGAARVWGAGATGSRLVTGTTRLHDELEHELASFLGAPSALVFSSGYLANLGALGVLAGPDTLVVSDTANHASLIDGCRLSRARVAVVPHRDVQAVRRELAARSEPGAVVVSDAVFSVDGDLAPLAALHDAAREHGAWLVVDEAHALGVVGPGGRGGCAAAGLAGEPDVVVTVTLSKSLGSMGGAVLGPTEVRDLLVNTARPFIFDTALAPPSAGAALAALRVLRADPGLADRARRSAADLAAAARAYGLHASRPEAGVVSVLIGDPELAVRARDVCAEAGVRVGCFRPPSVPPGGSCLRLTGRADLGAEDMARARTALAAVAELAAL